MTQHYRYNGFNASDFAQEALLYNADLSRGMRNVLGFLAAIEESDPNFEIPVDEQNAFDEAIAQNNEERLTYSLGPITLPHVVVEKEHVPEQPGNQPKKFSPLVPNEELVTRYQAGDSSALDDLIRQNKGIIHTYVNRSPIVREAVRRSGVLAVEDFEQASAISIIRAAKTYTQGEANFITYASKAIFNSIRNLASEHSHRLYRLPTGLIGMVHSARRNGGYVALEAETAWRTLDSVISLDTVGPYEDATHQSDEDDHTGILHVYGSGDDKGRMIRANSSYDQNLTTENTGDDIEFVIDEVDRLEMVERLLAPLNERERSVLMLRFGLHGLDQGLKPGSGLMPYERIAEEFNVGGPRIQQIIKTAFEKIRGSGQYSRYKRLLKAEGFLKFYNDSEA